MKKMVLLCAAVLACGGLAGCGQHKDNSSAKISSLKAENSSLKAKKSSNHKVKHHRKNSSSSQSTNNNASSTAQTAKGNGSNGTQTARSSNTAQGGNGGQQVASQVGSNPHTGDWHHDPDLWNAANNADYSGTIFQNATPQERYDYLWDQADHSPAPSNFNGQ
ncbi:MAG: lipoprotein [Limosilactobacillus sp.]